MGSVEATSGRSDGSRKIATPDRDVWKDGEQRLRHHLEVRRAELKERQPLGEQAAARSRARTVSKCPTVYSIPVPACQGTNRSDTMTSNVSSDDDRTVDVLHTDVYPRIRLEAIGPSRSAAAMRARPSGTSSHTTTRSTL